jgi:hypothetical protein
LAVKGYESRVGTTPRIAVASGVSIREKHE